LRAQRLTRDIRVRWHLSTFEARRHHVRSWGNSGLHAVHHSTDIGSFRLAASFGAAERPSREGSLPLDRSTIAGRAMCDLQPVQVADMQNAGDEFLTCLASKIVRGHAYLVLIVLVCIPGARVPCVACR
jgi:hypothetical protein